MTWPDLVSATAQWVFVFGIVPMLFAKEKPTLWAAVPFAVALWANAVALYAGGFQIAGLSCGLAASGWSILAAQRCRLNVAQQLPHFPLPQLPKWMKQVLFMD